MYVRPSGKYHNQCISNKWPLLTKRADDLPRDPGKSRSHEIGRYNDHIALKFDMSMRLSNLRAIGKFKPEFRVFKTSRDLAVRLCE